MVVSINAYVSIREDSFLTAIMKSNKPGPSSSKLMKWPISQILNQAEYAEKNVSSFPTTKAIPIFWQKNVFMPYNMIFENYCPELTMLPTSLALSSWAPRQLVKIQVDTRFCLYSFMQ